MRKIVAGKLHGIHVTEANLNYHGSITLDPDHCEEAGILPMDSWETWSKTSGARISTYVILGERGSRCCILNGAAARTCQPTPSIWTKRAFLSEAADRYIRHQQCRRLSDRWQSADADGVDD
ncbi:aspartate 1-decarboxylase [Mesorhizobium sp. M0895]|uniref:aspartate 1-decarboxylase n=1 Tax=Mesorhizobium sp. M0895 TaxID=2957019 RepID=UPI00333AFBE4